MLDMFDQVYAEQTPFLAAQKVGYADYLESFEGADMVDGPGADSDSPAGAVAVTAPGSDDGSRPEHAGPERLKDSTPPARVRRSPLMPVLTMAKALNAGLRRALEADPKVVIAGEDVGKLGGVFRVAKGLQKDFGDHQVIGRSWPSPESWAPRSAWLCAAIGRCAKSSSTGSCPAFDRIVSQVARLRFRSGGRLSGADGDPRPVRWRDRCGGASQ